jgi:hypothetical protein
MYSLYPAPRIGVSADAQDETGRGRLLLVPFLTRVAKVTLIDTLSNNPAGRYVSAPEEAGLKSDRRK